jgi:hypothetical protein
MRYALCERNPEVERCRTLASDSENRMRGDTVKAVSSQRERNPGGENAQESYALGSSLNRWVGWRTLTRSKTLKASKRHEGNGAGNSVRLRGRNKALEGDPKGGSGMEQGRQARGG